MQFWQVIAKVKDDVPVERRFQGHGPESFPDKYVPCSQCIRRCDKQIGIAHLAQSFRAVDSMLKGEALEQHHFYALLFQEGSHPGSSFSDP